MRTSPGEPVQVWLRHGKPARFVWRGRLYTVLIVLDQRLTPGSDEKATPPPRRECFLVEATPVRSVPPSTFELCRDLGTDRWSLTRT
jgi:hypothetical protein